MGRLRRRWSSALAAALASRSTAPAAALLAMLLALPSLAGGMQTEDFAHRSMSRAAHNLFFGLFGAPLQASRAEQLNYLAKDAGLMPWIASKNWHVAFFRPLTSLTLNLDYRLWPNSPMIMHAQSLLWLGLLVFAAGLLYRRLLPAGWVVGAAALLYAVDDGHGPVIGWLANRSALIASLFGVLALVFHDRWRRDRSTLGAIAAPLCLGLGLCAGEIAVGAVGYLVAYQVFIEPRVRPSGSKLARWGAPLVPSALALLAWAVPYELMGFGARGSGTYLDPVGQPLEFARAALERLPILLFGVFGAPVHWLPQMVAWVGMHGFLAVAWTFLAAVAVVGVFLARKEPSVRFFGAGALLSALPACTAIPQDRMLVLVGVGAFGVIALLFREVLSGGARRARWQFALSACVAAVCFAFHGVAAPILLPLRSRGLKTYNQALTRLERSAFDRHRPFSPLDHLVLVNAPDYYSAQTLLALAFADHRRVPFHTLVLYGGHDAITVLRSDARTLVVIAPGGFLSAPLDRVYRGASEPLHAGQGLQLSGVLIVVDRVNAQGVPVEMSFRFAAPLENPHLIWKVYSGDRYVPFRPPPVGRSVVLKVKFDIPAP